MGRSQGFTLVEILTGIGLLAIAAAVAVPGLSTLTAHYRLRSAVDQIAMEITRARAQAMAQNRYVCVSARGTHIDRLRGEVEENVGSCSALDDEDGTLSLPSHVSAESGDVVFSPGGIAVQNDSIVVSNPVGTKTIEINVLGRVTIL
jgi:prepilin-type N-terminal cleavage/methylation domain-containing protein